MKKMYQKPRMEIQEFMPTAYCAACFLVPCGYGNGRLKNGTQGNLTLQDHDPGGYGWSDDHVHVHHPDHCGTATNQEITIAADGLHFMLTEINSEFSGGRLVCELINGSQNLTTATVTEGTLIEWRNEGDYPNGKHWVLDHYGYAQVDSTRPNHS